MRRDMTQQVLQIVYDHFYATGGTWPSFGYVQPALNRQNDRRIDAPRIVRHIPRTLLKPLSSAYPAPAEPLILTLEGITRCIGSPDDVENYLTAVNWMARWAERSGLSDENEVRGMRFTISQLAEGVSLPLDSDRKAVNRLMAILESEGWIYSNVDTGRKS